MLTVYNLFWHYAPETGYIAAGKPSIEYIKLMYKTK